MIAEKAEHTPKERVRVLQRRLCSSAKANPNRTYGVLYDKITRRDVLTEAWRRVSANGGSPGVDGKSITWIRSYGTDRYLEELRQTLSEYRYHPKHIRRTHIPKPDGRPRPLGIPTVTDRVVQMAVKMVIEPLFEPDFLPCSLGFRPKRSGHQAIDLVDAYLQRGYRWVIDVDLKSYFDTIPHDRLMSMVQRRVRDPRILRLIRWWLKAGVVDRGEVTYPHVGSPQGGVLSPLLSNIYLHEVDRQLYHPRTGIQLVRYADDMILLCGTRDAAKKAHEHLVSVLNELDLTLNTDKTKVVRADKGFDFLGFSFRSGQYVRYGKIKKTIIKVPRAKARKGIRQRIKETIKMIPLDESVRTAVTAVNARLRGWANYFRIGNFWPAIKDLVYYTVSQLQLFLRRRYQRKRVRDSRRFPATYFHQRHGLYTIGALYHGI